MPAPRGDRNFGAYLKLARERKSLSTYDLADLTGIRRQTITSIELNRSTTLRAAWFRKLREALDLDFLEMFFQLGYVDREDLQAIPQLARIHAAVNRLDQIQGPLQELLEELATQERNASLSEGPAGPPTAMLSRV